MLVKQCSKCLMPNLACYRFECTCDYQSPCFSAAYLLNRQRYVADVNLRVKAKGCEIIFLGWTKSALLPQHGVK